MQRGRIAVFCYFCFFVVVVCSYIRIKFKACFNPLHKVIYKLQIREQLG